MNRDSNHFKNHPKTLTYLGFLIKLSPVQTDVTIMTKFDRHWWSSYYNRPLRWHAIVWWDHDWPTDTLYNITQYACTTIQTSYCMWIDTVYGVYGIVIETLWSMRFFMRGGVSMRKFTRIWVTRTWKQGKWIRMFFVQKITDTRWDMSSDFQFDNLASRLDIWKVF